MNMPRQNDTHAIDRQAAQWLVLLQDKQLTGPQRLAFEQWLASDPRHAESMHKARNAWHMMGLLQQDERYRQPITRHRSPLPGISPWRGLAFACLLVAVGLLGQHAHHQWPLWLAEHSTRHGETRTIELPDGSLADLDSQSAIDVHYDAQQRLVRLRSGRAVFSVAPMSGEEKRPFRVETLGGITEALGTRFLVSQEPGGDTLVGVLQHSVAVSLVEQPGQRQRLEQGDSLTYSRRHGLQPAGQFDLQRQTSWQRGVLIFDDQPLDEVLTHINRYSQRTLWLTDRALGQRRVSGLFRLGNIDQALDTIGQELALKQLHLPGLTLLYPSSPEG